MCAPLAQSSPTTETTYAVNNMTNAKPKKNHTNTQALASNKVRALEAARMYETYKTNLSV